MKYLLQILAITLAIFFGVPLASEDAKVLDLSRSQFTERNYNVMKTAKEEKCLTQAIYYEAGNQGELGKEAVALVVLNRVGAPHRPKTICGVIAQAHVIEDRKVCQFSFWCETRRKPMKDAWEESSKIAHRVLTNYWKRDILSQYSDASYYHADYVRPKWRTSKVFLGKIDKHLFYREP